MGFASRTDKAHSQNGCMQTASCRCDYCLPRKNWVRGSEKNNVRREIDAILAEAMGFEPVTLPGLKRITQSNRERIAMTPRVVPMCECGMERWECMLVNSWREIALSDCDHGCKLYEREHMGMRERQVQHSSTYGCHNTTVEPIEKRELSKAPKVQRITPTRRTMRTQPRGFVARPSANRSANFDVESPSILHMARARQAQLNGGRA